MKAMHSQQIQAMATQIFWLFAGDGSLLPNADALRLNFLRLPLQETRVTFLPAATTFCDRPFCRRLSLEATLSTSYAHLLSGTFSAKRRLQCHLLIGYRL